MKDEEAAKLSIKKLADLLEKAFKDKNDDDFMPDIGQCSEEIEQQKFKLAQLFEKKNYNINLFLTLINMVRIFERNLYAATGQILKDKKEIDSVLKELNESLESMMRGLKSLYKKILENKDE